MGASESFWNNAAQIITAVGVVFIGALSAILTYKLNKVNKKVETVDTKLKEVGENVNGKIDKLLQGKDDIAKAKDDAERLGEAKIAAHDSGKLEAMQEQKKDDALKNTPSKQ